jgi:hypothetical protein
LNQDKISNIENCKHCKTNFNPHAKPNKFLQRKVYVLVVKDLEKRARQIKDQMRPGSVTPNLSDSDAMRSRHRRGYDRSVSRERGYPPYDRDVSGGRRKGNTILDILPGFEIRSCL